MKKLFNLLIKNVLVKGSLIVFIGAVLANIGNYIFHLLMGRWLGPADYGVLESLVSILSILLIPTGVLNLLVAKFISEKEKQSEVEKNSFLRFVMIKSSLVGLIILTLFFIFYQTISSFIKIDSFMYFLIIGICFYGNIFVTIFLSVLQGKLEFVKYCFLNILNSWLKLTLGIILVLSGLGVIGAISSFTLSSLITVAGAYFLIYKSINLNKNIFSGQKPDVEILQRVKKYSLTSLVSSVSMVMLFSIDILLARIYLSPVMAGQYAALSVLGKIIFFASSPIITVMFPMVSEKESKGEKYLNFVLLSIVLVLIISAVIGILFSIFSSFFVQSMFGQKYLESSSNLGLFAIFITLYTLSYLLTSFYLSISRNKMVIFPLLAVLLQIILIVVLHQTIQQIVTVNIAVLLFLFLVLAAKLLIMYKVDCSRQGSNNNGAD